MNIKSLRIKKNISQTELAKRVNLSAGYLCHLENGTRLNPSLKVLNDIASVLGVDVKELI